MLRSECDLNWLHPFIFGWPGLKVTVTPIFTKSVSFLNRVNILIFKSISNNLELLSFQKMHGLRGYLLTIYARRVLEGGLYLKINSIERDKNESCTKAL